jgi:hypothetical protein
METLGVTLTLFQKTIKEMVFKDYIGSKEIQMLLPKIILTFEQDTVLLVLQNKEPSNPYTI